MASALHHQAQIVLARKVHPSGKILSAGGGDGPATSAGCPSTQPASGLEPSRLFLDPKGVAQVGQNCCCCLMPRQRRFEEFTAQLAAKSLKGLVVPSAIGGSG